jgi:hypothetical protein
LAATSRLTVDAERPIRLAIAANVSPAPSPARISSRSSNDKRNADRGRCLDAIPPSDATSRCTERAVQPTAAALSSTLEPEPSIPNTTNRSARDMRANFDRPSDTTTSVIVQRPLEANCL